MDFCMKTGIGYYGIQLGDLMVGAIVALNSFGDIFDWKTGQKIALVGPTGAGKTTIVNLLMKFYNIDNGDIIIDGHSINELTRENVHDLFTMVLQDTWIFEGTIKENIRYNNKDISFSTKRFNKLINITIIMTLFNSFIILFLI